MVHRLFSIARARIHWDVHHAACKLLNRKWLGFHVTLIHTFRFCNRCKKRTNTKRTIALRYVEHTPCCYAQRWRCHCISAPSCFKRSLNWSEIGELLCDLHNNFTHFLRTRHLTGEYQIVGICELNRISIPLILINRQNSRASYNTKVRYTTGSATAPESALVFAQHTLT